MKPLKNFASVLSLAVLLANPAFAAPETRRLIETSPGRVFWTTQAERDAISARAHEAGRCGGYVDLTNAMSALAASSPIDFAKFVPSQHALVTPLMGLCDSAKLMDWIAKLSKYHNRHYESPTGAESANWIAEQYRAIAGGRTDIKVTTVKHSFAQPSVVARIDGSGPKKNEIVVIGGHIDSINHKAGLFKKKSKAVAPGADDNASGTATVLETFRLIVESGLRPNRTIEFMGYAGEEAGLLGSQDIAERYRKAKTSVVGAFQLDMTMFPGATPAITFITDHTYDGLTGFTQKISDEYVKAKWRTSECGYGCSDHASWDRNGYASVFPAESTLKESNPDIHSADDTSDKLDPSFGTHFLKLAVAFAIELAQAP